jgi:hypothetical protein
MRYFILFLFIQNIIYAQKSNINAFLLKPETIEISLRVEKVNDALDIFNIKKSEVSRKKSNFQTIGDMHGVNFNLGYTLNKKWYLNLNLNRKTLDYSNSELINNQIDFYLRYQLYSYNNIAFAIDIGYKSNRADDVFLTNTESINDIIEDIFPNKEIELKEIDNQQILIYQEDNRAIKTIKLENKASISIKDTYDSSFYSRIIFSLTIPLSKVKRKLWNN